MDIHKHRIRRDKLVFLKIVLQSCYLNQLLNINQSSSRLMAERCGQIDITIDYDKHHQVRNLTNDALAVAYCRSKNHAKAAT